MKTSSLRLSVVGSVLILMAACNAMTGVSDLEVTPSGAAGAGATVGGGGSAGGGGTAGTGGAGGGVDAGDGAGGGGTGGVAGDGGPGGDAGATGEAGAPGDGPIEGGDVTDGSSCPSGKKLCGADCVPNNDPNTGCGAVSCDPCNLGHAVAVCAGQQCAIDHCTLNYQDCDGDTSNGCEVQLNTDVNHCGSCLKKCQYANADALCQAGNCFFDKCKAGYTDCDGNPDTNGCEVHTDVDVVNCGKCGSQCSFQHGVASCVGGGCVLSKCDAGYSDCNANTADGCETYTDGDAKNCNTCGNVCPGAVGKTPICTKGVCGLSDCQTPLADCDKDGMCEAHLDTDAANCGFCGNICSFTNATAKCAASQCHIDVCAVGFGNCDANESNGCETSTVSDPANCSACGNNCGSLNWPNVTAYVCTASHCGIGGCKTNTDDCDGTATNGCEIDLTSNPDNCGGCKIVCSANNVAPRTCGSGRCNGTCAAGFDDCNNDKQVDGCETLLATSPDNCGGCGRACSKDHMATVTCNGGTCDGACDPAYLDCDKDKRSNGCELRADDGNDCTKNDCARTFELPGAPCSQNGGTVCNGAGLCGVCVPGQKRCAGTGLKVYQVCGANGQWPAGTTCSIECDISQPSGCATVTKIAAGGGHTCAVLNNGDLFCWGGNAYGQLGTDDTTPSLVPTQIKINLVEDVSLGIEHTCVLLQNGNVKCWGHNDMGQLGDGTTSDQHAPPKSPILGNVTQLRAGDMKSNCALDKDGVVSCWGFTLDGQGPGGVNATLSPAKIDPGARAVHLGVGGYHACAVVSVTARSYEIVCWGDNAYGQLGNSKAPTDSAKPVSVVDPGAGGDAGSGYDGWRFVAGGVYSGYAWGQTGLVDPVYDSFGWGANGNYRVGDSTTVQRNAPVLTTKWVLGTASQISFIDGGGGHACALVFVGKSATPRCWGSNKFGQAGGPVAGPDTNIPADILNGGRPIYSLAMAVGLQHNCVVDLAGTTVYCWGDGAAGQLGNNSTKPSDVPVVVRF